MAGDIAQGRYWMGFDLGGTKMLATVFDSALMPQGSYRRKTKAWKGREACLERMENTISEALEQAGVEVDQLAGIGVGSPGPLDLNEGIMLETPNFEWGRVPLKETLQAKFRCPVAVINDVDAGVYGEYKRGAACGSRCVLGVFPGTGIGGGCVYEGRILRGLPASALEIGHMQVQPDGPLCGCGNRGCLEAVASRVSIAAAAAAAAYRGQAPHLLEEKGMDVGSIRSGALSRAVQAGDTVVEQIIRDAARWLGVGIANAVNLLAADRVVLGGGLVEEFPELFRHEAGTSAHQKAMAVLRDFEVVVSALGDDATVTGAAAWASEHLHAQEQREPVANHDGKA